MADISETIAISGGEAILQLLENIKRAGETSFRSLEQSTKNAGGSIERIGESITSVGEKFLLIGGAVAAAAGGFIALVAGGARAAEELKNTAASVGLTIEQLQGLTFAAGQAGVEADKFVQAITRFDRAIGEAQKQSRGFANDLQDLAIKNSRAFEDSFRSLTNQEAGFGKFTKFFVDSQRTQAREIEDFNLKVARSDNVFTRLGVSVTDASGKLRSTNDVLLEVADKFKALPESAQKTADALQLVGRGGAAMIPFLNKGKAGIEEFIADLAKIAPAVTPAQAAIGEHFEEALRRAETATTNLKNAFVATFQPGLTHFFDDLTKAVVKNRESILQFAKDLNTAFGDIKDGASDVGKQIAALGSSLLDLLPVFGEIKQFSFKDVFKELEDAIRGIRIGLEFIKGIKIENTGFGTFKLEFGSFEDAVNKVRAADEAVKELKPHLDDVGHAAHTAADEVKKIGTAGQAAAENVNKSFVSAGSRVIQLGTDINNAITKSSITGGGARIIQIDDTQIKQQFETIKKEAQTTTESIGTSFTDLGKNVGESFDGIPVVARDAASAIDKPFSATSKTVVKDFDLMTQARKEFFETFQTKTLKPGDSLRPPRNPFVGPGDQGFDGIDSDFVKKRAAQLEKDSDAAFATIVARLKKEQAALPAITPKVDTAPAIQAITDLPVSFEPAVNEIETQFANTGLKIRGSFEELDTIPARIAGSFEALGSTFDQTTGDAQSAAERISSAFQDLGSIGSSLEQGFTSAYAAIVGEAPSAAQQVDDAFNDLGSAGQELQQGLESTFATIVGDAQSAGRRVADAFKDLGGGGGGGGGEGFASGGQVHGRPGRDKIPAWLTNREFVHNTGAVDYYGVRFMHAINRRLIPRDMFKGFNLGGLVSIPAQKPLRFASGGQATSGQGLRPLSLTIGADTFAGLMAPEAVAQKLIKAATSRALNSAGRKPSGYGG